MNGMISRQVVMTILCCCCLSLFVLHVNCTCRFRSLYCLFDFSPLTLDFAMFSFPFPDSALLFDSAARNAYRAASSCCSRGGRTKQFMISQTIANESYRSFTDSLPLVFKKSMKDLAMAETVCCGRMAASFRYDLRRRPSSATLIFLPKFTRSTVEEAAAAEADEAGSVILMSSVARNVGSD